eukprot:5999964-Pyramimonas_sp.AAC.1
MGPKQDLSRLGPLFPVPAPSGGGMGHSLRPRVRPGPNEHPELNGISRPTCTRAQKRGATGEKAPLPKSWV